MGSKVDSPGIISLATLTGPPGAILLATLLAYRYTAPQPPDNDGHASFEEAAFAAAAMAAG